MAISKQALTYCKRGIIQYLNGDIEEFKRLVGMAVEGKEEPTWTSCLYKTNGKKVKAKIDFKTGVIIDPQGNILRRATV